MHQQFEVSQPWDNIKIYCYRFIHLNYFMTSSFNQLLPSYFLCRWQNADRNICMKQVRKHLQFWEIYHNFPRSEMFKNVKFIYLESAWRNYYAWKPFQYMFKKLTGRRLKHFHTFHRTSLCRTLKQKFFYQQSTFNVFQQRTLLFIWYLFWDNLGTCKHLTSEGLTSHAGRSVLLQSKAFFPHGLPVISTL